MQQPIIRWSALTAIFVTCGGPVGTGRLVVAILAKRPSVEPLL